MPTIDDNDNYFKWRNGTLVVVDWVKMQANGFHNSYQSYKNTVGEVCHNLDSYKDSNGIALWWPKLNKFENWSPQYIKKLNP